MMMILARRKDPLATPFLPQRQPKPTLEKNGEQRTAAAGTPKITATQSRKRCFKPSPPEKDTELIRSFRQPFRCSPAITPFFGQTINPLSVPRGPIVVNVALLPPRVPFLAYNPLDLLVA